jgi:hypothetical protein
MVDSGLLEQVLQLDDDSKRELIRAVEGTLPHGQTPPHILAEIDRRLATMGPNADPSAMTLDEFERRLYGRRPA